MQYALWFVGFAGVADECNKVVIMAKSLYKNKLKLVL
jgi:hypothetical protein